MNLVQLAEHAKNLSNQQLQQMLQAPTGEMPPFLLAAEAARRQDVERSAQVGPVDNTTVLDELIQGRAQATGLNALTNQAAVPAAPQPQQSMRGGGGVMALAIGGVAPPVNKFRKDNVNPAFPPIGETWGGFSLDPQNIGPALDNVFGYGETDPDNPIPSAGLDPAEDAGEKSRLRNAMDNEAFQKMRETANKQTEMGNPETITDEGGGEPEADEFRDRLDAIYGEEDDVQRLWGMSSSGLAGIGAALLSNERGLSEGERWANAAAALAGDTEARDLKKQKVSQEEAMAMLKYDMAKKAKDDATSSADIGNMAEGYKNSATYFLDIGKAYASQANDLRKAYQQTDPFGAVTGVAPIPQEVEAKIAQLEQASRDAFLRAQYNQAQYGGIYGVEPYDAVWDGGELRTR